MLDPFGLQTAHTGQHMNWKYPLVGAVTFAGFHLALTATWQTWFHGGGGHSPWFLNTLEGVLAAALVFFIVGLTIAFLKAEPTVAKTSLRACQVVAGAALPTIGALAVLPGGPGSLAPLAIVIGIIVLLVPSVAGALAGHAARRFLTVPERA
jgi:hypothetical protein